jgi:putative membrane protein
MYITNRRAALVLALGVALGACADKADDNDTAAVVEQSSAGTVDTGARTGSMDATAPRNDAEILTLVSHSNSAEIASSKLALEQAQNAQVKAYAQDMIKAHTAMEQEGSKLGATLGVGTANTDKAEDKREDTAEDLDELREARNAQFDKAYMKFQVEAHEKTLKMLQDQQDKAQNAELKAMITKAIPQVQQHLTRAEQLRKAVDG